MLPRCELLVEGRQRLSADNPARAGSQCCSGRTARA